MEVANFTQKEFRNTKYLIDKSSGVFNIDKRYLHGNNSPKRKIQEKEGKESWNYKIVEH